MNHYSLLLAHVAYVFNMIDVRMGNKNLDTKKILFRTNGGEKGAGGLCTVSG